MIALVNVFALVHVIVPVAVIALVNGNVPVTEEGKRRTRRYPSTRRHQLRREITPAHALKSRNDPLNLIFDASE